MDFVLAVQPCQCMFGVIQLLQRVFLVKVQAALEVSLPLRQTSLDSLFLPCEYTVVLYSIVI